MSGSRIPDSYIQELLSRIDIVEFIGRSVTLKKHGLNYFACCPFHREKSPSFTVSPTKQFYHCFGCGAHGSAIGFEIEQTGDNFRDVVVRLGKENGMAPLDEAILKKDDSLLAVSATLEVAGQYFEQELYKSDEARQYVRTRGLTQGTAKKYGIGFAPGGWQNLKDAFPNYNDDVLLKAGLVIESEQKQGRRYDRFRSRLMFPIHGTSGRVIGFGGRVIGEAREDEPKYLNSPEIVGFEKGRELYGLYQARLGIKNMGCAYIVEGYMDVVMLAQNAVENAVATLGTACTPEHITKMLRITDNLYFAFDGDAAGRKAAWRALENSLERVSDHHLVAFIFLPEGKDPDDYVKEYGAEGFHALRTDALPLSRFLLQELEANVDMRSAEGRAKLVSDAKPYLQRMTQAPALRVGVAKLLSEKTGMTMAELEKIIGMRFGGEAARRLANRKQAEPASIVKRVIEIVVTNPQEAHRINHEWLNQELREEAALVNLVAIANSLTGDVPPAWVAQVLAGSEYADVYNHAYAAAEEVPLEGPEWEQVYSDALVQLEARWVEQQLRLLTERDKDGKLDREGRVQFMNFTRRAHDLRKSMVRDEAEILTQ